MRKTFPIRAEVDSEPHPPTDPKMSRAVKVEISRYVKRERRKALPEGVDFWDFRCRVGATEETAKVSHISSVPGAVDAIAEAGGATVYVEILACAGHRKKQTAPESPGSPEVVNP